MMVVMAPMVMQDGSNSDDNNNDETDAIDGDEDEVLKRWKLKVLVGQTSYVLKSRSSGKI